MGPSEKSFNQVKAILGKLDRSIDQLRAARVSPSTPTGPLPTLVPAAPSKGTGRAGGPAFGRATPLPPRD